MKTKSKTFARKLTALFLAAIMAISCFMGTVTAFAKSTDEYHDSKLAYNFMTWAETTDNQTCEALLDWADLYLGDLLSGLLGTDHIFFEQNVVVTTIRIDAYLDSIDGVIDLLRQANDLLSSYGGIVGGDVKNVNLSPLPNLAGGYAIQGEGVISKCGKSWRQNNDAKAIVMALAQTLYLNSVENGTDRDCKNVIGQFVKGQLNLGSILEGVLGGDVYSLLKGALGMWDGYQSNLVFNIVANLILTKTEWFSASEMDGYLKYLKGESGGVTFNFDEVLLEKLSTELLQKINVDVTYDVQRKNVQVTDEETGDEDEDIVDKYLDITDDSKAHYAAMKQYVKEHSGTTLRDAAIHFGYDPDLHYTDDGNVYLFRYGYQADGETPTKVFTIDKNTSILEAAYNALEIAWSTVLKDTMNLIHVNYSNWENDQAGLGTNFDNAFFYWRHDQGKWNKANWASNYTRANVQEWADAVYETYGYPNAAEFMAQVEADVTLDRKVAELGPDETPSWRNIDATRLFMKLRYSPLADKCFNIQTGPINLYILQTGYSNFKQFMDTVFTQKQKYNGIVSALNDALVAVVKDIFPQSANIGIQNPDGSVTSLTLTDEDLQKTNGTEDGDVIADTLVGNALRIFEYAANCTDLNILNPYFTAHHLSTYKGNLSEANFEEAMIPMLIACVTQIDMLDPVHPEAWDMAKDAEGVAFIALREYLSYVLPDKNYDQLVSTASGSYKACVDLDNDGQYNLYKDVILPMARDAVGYLLNSIVPCRKPDGSAWNVYDTNVLTDKTTLFEILNSVICYYGSTDTFTEPGGGTTQGKGVAALLGCVDSSGKCTVKLSNTLWQNINNISNQLMPVFGTLQYGTTAKAGQSDSKEIIYDTIVMGLLDIGTVNEHSGKYGIATILKQVVTIATGAPMKKSLLKLVYDDVLASLINGVLGARANGDFAKVIPTSADYDSDSSNVTKSSTPFNSLVHADTIAQYQSGNGIIGVAVYNIYRFFGGNGNYNTDACAKGCWQGAMFAVVAVNNFIPSFAPSLSEHKFNAATLSIDNPSERVKAGETRATTYINFTNNCRGLNKFYKDASGNIVRKPRFFINMKSAMVTLADGSSVGNVSVQLPNQKIVAPEKVSKITLNGRNVQGTQLLKFEVTYDIFEGEYTFSGSNKVLPSVPANPLYKDLKATCYLYLTTEKGWVEATFTDVDGTSQAWSSGSKDSYMGLTGSNGTYTSVDLGSSTVYINNDLVISTADTAQIDNYGLRASGVDGLYAIDEKGDAYAVFDAKNGDLLNTGLVDYKYGKNAAWNRGSTTTVNGVTVYEGYDANDLATLAQQADDQGVEWATRPHVALTLEEAGSLVKSTKMDGDNYKVITVDTDLIHEHLVSASTPTHGISFLDIRDAQGDVVKYLKYDGTTKISADNYTMTVVAYQDYDTTEKVDVNVVLANDAEANTLKNVYDNYIKEMAPYQATDFNDYNKGYGSSDTNDALQSTFQSAVQAMSRPITLADAASLVSKYETVAKQSETTSTMGDVAYTPIPSSEPITYADLADTAVQFNGYWYADKEHTMPIYKNVELSTANQSLTVDAAGTPIIFNEDDHKYHVATTPEYEYAWNTTSYTYPYYAKTNVQAKNSKDEALYLNTQYQYFKADGKQVSSGDDWSYKYAISETRIKENTAGVDNRGYYQQLIDSLHYNVAEAKKNIDMSMISLVTEDIIEARKNKNNVNYQVAEYEKMVKIAKEAESLVYVDGKVEDPETGKLVDRYLTTASSVELKEANRQFTDYADIVEHHYNRGYIGDKLEAEILCASGLDKDHLTASITRDEDEKITSASVSRKSGSTAAKYGSFNASGVLVNVDATTGEKAYSDSSWNNYVTELAKSVEMAEAASAQCSGIYTQKCALAIAENNLVAPLDATTYIFSGTVALATNAEGTQGGAGVEATFHNGMRRIGSSNADGTFELQIDLGVTEIRVHSPNGQFKDRIITVSGEDDVTNATIPVNGFDLNNDDKINSTDVVIYSNAPFDINGDNNANANDGAIYKSILRSGVNFGSLALD